MREAWQLFEEHICNQIQTYDNTAKLTIGSGRFRNGDIIGKHLVVECKWRDNPHSKFERSVWQKVEREAYRLKKYPLLICANDRNQSVVMTHSSLFLDVIPNFSRYYTLHYRTLPPYKVRVSQTSITVKDYVLDQWNSDYPSLIWGAIPQWRSCALCSLHLLLSLIYD